MPPKKKQPRIIVAEDTDEMASCPHDMVDPESCPECLKEIIDILGTQLDTANDFTDELVDEINKLDAIYHTSLLIRDELKRSLDDPKRKLGAAVMMKLMEPVFNAIDDYETSIRITKSSDKPDTSKLN
jgi:hypothetical protein